MGRIKLRENKKCQNCGRFVAERFCPHCGQENVETRQRFHILFIQFIEDFIHYDNHFWRTIQYLLFRPARLTQAYLAGKRKSYVPPVKLYIFISFLVFFVPAILPEQHETHASKNLVTTNNEADIEEFHKEIDDNFQHPVARTIVREIIDNVSDEAKKEKALEAVFHHFPKAIFLYMPVFAFWLWLFHSKRKWLYFDHGIYTLHYFSFILLSILLYILAGWLLSLFQKEISDGVTLALIGYFIYYFFHSHRLMYGETKAKSRIKCIWLFLINTFLMLVYILTYFIVVALFFADKS